MPSATLLTRGGVGIAAAIVVLHGCSASKDSDGDFDEVTDLDQAVISCEEAYARLERCCPSFHAKRTNDDNWSQRCLDLEYQRTSGGCGGPTTVDRGHVLPSLAIAESRCIRDTSCEDLVSTGVCDRARTAKPRGSRTTKTTSSSTSGSGGSSVYGSSGSSGTTTSSGSSAADASQQVCP